MRQQNPFVIIKDFRPAAVLENKDGYFMMMMGVFGPAALQRDHVQ